jgi:hypothetical protein
MHPAAVSRRALLAAAGWSMLACALPSLAAVRRGTAPLGGAAGARPTPLDAKSIGHIRHFIKLARQPAGDWSEMGDGGRWLGVPERTLRYQLANMAYALASVQHNVTPAYREVYRETLNALFQRLLEPDCWREWVNVSRGGSFANPDQQGLLEGSFDPIAKYNIMYGGHVLHVAALIDVLYGERRYTSPGSIRLEWVERNWGPGPQTFEYDIGRIARNFYAQFRDYDYQGFPCEPNLMFPECPQHAVLGLVLADHLYGTQYGEEVRERYLTEFHKLGFVDEATGSVKFAVRRAQHQFVEGPPMAWADAWTGLFMHAWAPEYVANLYGAQRDRHVPNILDRRSTGLPLHPAESGAALGYFAPYAAELGDEETVARLLEFADAHYAPVWREGRYLYPRNDDASVDAAGVARQVAALAGNALIPFGRLHRADGLRRLHAELWTDEVRAQPELTRVDYAASGVSEAYFDATRRELSISLVPGPLATRSATFAVQRFDAARPVAVAIDGRMHGEIASGTERGAITRSAGGELVVTYDARRAARWSFIAL